MARVTRRPPLRLVRIRVRCSLRNGTISGVTFATAWLNLGQCFPQLSQRGTGPATRQFVACEGKSEGGLLGIVLEIVGATHPTMQELRLRCDKVVRRGVGLGWGLSDFAGTS